MHPRHYRAGNPDLGRSVGVDFPQVQARSNPKAAFGAAVRPRAQVRLPARVHSRAALAAGLVPCSAKWFLRALDAPWAAHALDYRGTRSAALHPGRPLPRGRCRRPSMARSMKSVASRAPCARDHKSRRGPRRHRARATGRRATGLRSSRPSAPLDRRPDFLLTNRQAPPIKYYQIGGARTNEVQLPQVAPAPDIPSSCRASAGVATVSPRISITLAAFSTSAALLGASLPRSRYRLSSSPTRTWPPSNTACATIGNWCSEIPNANHGEFAGSKLRI